VKFAQSKLQLKNLEIHEGYLHTLQKSNVDLIYSVDVFEHIAEDKMPFADAYERLKTGGYLMVKMPHVTQTSVFPASWFKAHEDWLMHEHPGQVYSLNDLKQRFEKEGFTITFAERTDGKISRLAWEIAYLMKRGGSLLQLVSLPICKSLIAVDMLRQKQNAKHGNAITVIGQKN
jgi:cyclopropane fatty-acyl-phospholipid synthase-like methyltransferase